MTRVSSTGRFLLIAGLTALFAWLFLRQVDLGQALEEAGRLPVWAVTAALTALLANLAFATVRWRYLLAAAGYDVPLGRLLSTIAAGIAVNNLLPARAGDLVRIESLRSGERIPAFVVAGTLFAERILDGLVLAGWIVVGALLLGTGGPLLLTGLALSAGSVLGLALIVLAAAKPVGSRRLARRALTPLPRRWNGRAEHAALSFLDGLSAFRPGRTLALALATSVPVWLADLGLYVALGQAFGIDAGLGGYLALEGVGNLALAVPSTAAGVGSFDYLTLLAARGIAADGPAASAYVLALHVFTVVPVSLLGLAFVGRVLPRRRRVLAGEATAA